MGGGTDGAGWSHHAAVVGTDAAGGADAAAATWKEGPAEQTAKRVFKR